MAGPSTTIIPDDAPGKAVYLYHKDHPSKSQRIDLTKEDAKEKEAAFVREGWTRQRFAKVYFHRIHGTQVVTDASKIKALEKIGWQDKPFEPNDPKLSTNPAIRAQVVHPHAEDANRQAYIADLQEQAAS